MSPARSTRPKKPRLSYLGFGISRIGIRIHESKLILDFERKLKEDLLETAIFRCDFCGARSEEEMIGWRRPRCSVEIILRGHRFVSRFDGHTSATLLGAPFAPPPIPGDMPPPLDDERWSSALCDKCMKRIAALFGLPLETPEEVAQHEAQVAERVAQQAARGAAEMASLRGQLVQQFPTPPAAGSFVADKGKEGGSIDDNGGMVAQFPTESPESLQGSRSAYAWEPPRKSGRRKRNVKKSKRA